MASIYQLKPAFQNLLRPLVQRLASAGVTANQVTVFACLVSVGVGALVWFFPQKQALWWLIPLVFPIRMALNAIDGMLAREHNMKSNLGAILNELTDVISDIALYLPFMQIVLRPEWVAGAVLLAMLTEMTGVIGVQIGASRRYDGPMGKSDRAFVFGVLGVVAAINPNLVSLFDIPMVLVNLSLVVTVVNRARKALKEVS